ncbi:MAG TPA: LLM class flavin-dependent oxidoreductase [Pseudonocardiaceae bacterium]|nr:LLM class flavin-dependent oxidoreductase [Pseudonocardiaceae bacterium]
MTDANHPARRRVEAGVQVHLPSYLDSSLAELTGIATTAASAGFDQVWVTDNLECRNTFVVLAAFAPVVRAKLGTAIMAQYFRSPVEAARSLTTVSELMAGRELSVGLGTGNPTTSRLIEMPRPVGFMRQTAQCLRALLDGAEIEMDHYPLLRDHFRFAPGARLRVAAMPAGPIRLYGGGNGPRGLALAGELMEGLIFGWTTKLNATLGRVKDKLDIVAEAASAAGRAETFRRVTELKISVARDHAAARRFVREDPSCARRTLGLRKRGYTDDDLRQLGIDPVDVDALDRAYQAGGPFADFSELVTDAMIDASYIAGDPANCAERMAEFAELVREHRFEQVIFSELGPDPAVAVELIAGAVLPVLASV